MKSLQQIAFYVWLLHRGVLALAPSFASWQNRGSRVATTAIQRHTSTLHMSTDDDASNTGTDATTADVSAAIDDATAAFSDGEMDADALLAAIEDQLGVLDTIDTSPSKKNAALAALNNLNTPEVTGALKVAKSGLSQVVKGVEYIATESLEFTNHLNETLVGSREDAQTYEEALDKVGSGAQGVWKLASSLGGFVKNAVDKELESGQTQKVLDNLVTSASDKLADVSSNLNSKAVADVEEIVVEEEIVEEIEEEASPAATPKTLMGSIQFPFFNQQSQREEIEEKEEVLDEEIQDEAVAENKLGSIKFPFFK